MNLLMKPVLRWCLLLLVLTALLYLNFFPTHKRPPVLAEAVKPAKPSISTVESAVSPNLPGWRAVWEHEVQDIFQTPAPPAPPPRVIPRPQVLKPTLASVVATEPTAPVPPALPYTVLGQFMQNQQRTLYLSGPSGVLAVKQGDLLPGGEYRVEELGARQAKLAYLPMNYVHVLALDTLE